VAELLPVVCDELAKLPGDLSEPEVKRAAAQLRAATLMSREKPSARCEQLASQLLIYGRPIPPAEAVARIDAVTIDDLRRLARRLTQSPPTLTALGPIGQVMEYDALRKRLS
jgi:predicted Zn-dependent peptidase